MNSIWAVARHTFAQCLRMKIAVAFLLLLAVSLAVLPFIMKGDGTLAGGIRTCLSYSVRITGVLLSIVTVLVTVGVVSGDIREKHIFLLAAKPLARWEYMIGRWLGVVLLNAVLLGIAGLSIYFVVQHLRSGVASSVIDRQVVETEIFTARNEIKPQRPDIQSVVEKRIEELKKNGQYESIVKDFQDKNNIPADKAQELLITMFSQEALAAREVAPPNGLLTWTFKDVDVAGTTQQGQGKILDMNKQAGRYRIQASPRLVGHLFSQGPVEINGIAGRVVAIGQDKAEGEIDIAFDQAEMQNAIVKDMETGQAVTVKVEPTFQFKYKVTVIGDLRPGQSSVYRELLFGKPPVFRIKSDTPIKSATSVTVPALKSLRTGDIQIGYWNRPAPLTGPMQFYMPINPVQISYKDVSILYRIGDFDANFFRAMLLVFCQLVFLAALGIFFGCFLSFPVASLACMVLLVCGWMMNWLVDAVKWSSKGGEFSFVGASGKGVLMLTKILMPNLSETSPAERLVDGIFISWSTVGDAAITGIAIRAVFFLAVGCLIFHKRELAKVQV